MKLKGKAIFELTNVETGEKRVVKEENMVTNAFQYLVNAGGGLGGGPHVITRASSLNGSFYYMSGGVSTNNYGNSMAKNLLRRYTNGLLLFSGPLEENADHVYVTADDPDLVGAGAELAYIGAQTCAGSYNSTESGKIENGYKHVWDFTTSQANGDIGCACLTTLMGAGMGGGSGFPTGVSDWFGTLTSETDSYVGPHQLYCPPFDDYKQSPTFWGRVGYYDLGRNLFIRPKYASSFVHYGGSASTLEFANEVDINGKVVATKFFDRSIFYKKSIDLGVYRLPYSDISIFDVGATENESFKFSGTSTGTAVKGHMPLLRTVTVEMPTALQNAIPQDIVNASINTNYYWPTTITFDEGFMYISFVIPTSNNSSTGIQLKSGDKIHVWKINMNTFESSYFTITNTTGQMIQMYYYHSPVFNGSFGQWIVTNEYTILFSNPQSLNGHMWIIDNATGSTIKQVMTPNDTVFSKPDSYAYHFVRNNMLYLCPAAEVTNQMYYIVNLKTGYVHYGYACGLSRMYICGRTYGTKLPLFYYCSGDRSYNSNHWYGYTKFYADPNVLMTINNLEDVVTKTSAETMKVTYILTQEDVEE